MTSVRDALALSRLSDALLSPGGLNRELVIRILHCKVICHHLVVLRVLKRLLLFIKWIWSLKKVWKIVQL